MAVLDNGFEYEGEVHRSLTAVGQVMLAPPLTYSRRHLTGAA